MNRTILMSLSAFAGLGLASTAHVAPSLAQTNMSQAASCTDGTGPTSGFFCVPRAQGNPVRACTTGGLSGTRLTTCRQTTADSFCRTVAFSRAAAFQVNPAGALAEVTCTGRQAQTAMVTTPATVAPRTTAPTTTPAPTPPPPAPPTVQQDYVYATGHTNLDGSVTTKPILQVSAFGAEMTGFTTITNSAADFDSFYQGGVGTYTAGRFTGTFANNVWRGIWRENEDEQGLRRIQITCDRPDGGTRVWGQFEIRFTPDRRSFTGTMTLCDTAVADANSWDKNSWKGTLTGRASASVAPSVAAPTGPTPSFASSPSSSPPTSRSPGTQRTSQPSQPRQETAADRIAREAAAAAEQRAKDEARQSVNRAIDGLIRRPR